jgi:hypothetical protein
LGFDTTADTGSATSHTADNVLPLDFPSYLLILATELSGADAATTANFHANFCILISHNSQYMKVFNEGSNFVNQQPYTIGKGINTLKVRIQ